MCLFAVAHRASGSFPLVIAANRDEAHDRPTVPAGFWSDEPGILGGRDARMGGSWLAIDRRGRFAAVTNLRSSRGVIGRLSRGELVRRFVSGDAGPMEYEAEVAGHAADYAGFHLVAGVAGGEVALLSGTVSRVRPGILALSNADPGIRWPKVDAAEKEMKRLISMDNSADLAASAMRFLTGGNHEPTVDATGEVFVTGDLYGTRASTVIVVDAAGGVLFVEQSFAAGGIADGPRREFRFTLSPLAA